MNFKTLYTIFNGINASEFYRICNCEIVKKVFDILPTTHERTTVVQVSKLQKLTIDYENLHIADETFDDCYVKLNNIVNSFFNLGEKMTDSKVVYKILRSLSKMFQTKVTTTIEKRNCQ